MFSQPSSAQAGVQAALAQQITGKLMQELIVASYFLHAHYDRKSMGSIVRQSDLCLEMLGIGHLVYLPLSTCLPMTDLRGKEFISW